MCVFALCFLSAVAQEDSITAEAPADSTEGLIAYQLLNIPALLGKVDGSRPIVIAVVDNGFRLTHEGLRDFIYTNAREIQGNGIDDDINGTTDDVHGFDVSDYDGDVSVPAGKEMSWYHGTMIAGIITKVAGIAFGNTAPKYIQILPVKVLSDNAKKNYYYDGYAGIAYAVKQNVDIIVCAWSGGIIDDKYRQVFEEASAKGIMIIGSAGNFFSEKIEAPASILSVFTVAAVDSTMHKLKSSNYGRKVDICAPADLIYAPHPVQDNAWSFIDRTSGAAALIAGCAAILKVADNKATPHQIAAALKNTAIPLDSINTMYGGKLGAGFINISEAVKFLLEDSKRNTYFDSRRPEGDIIINKSADRKFWEIAPVGGYKGVNIYLVAKNGSEDNLLKFYIGTTLYKSYTVKDFPGSQFVPGSKVRIEYEGKRSSKPLVLSYWADALDSTTMYCSGITNFSKPEGVITDGSGDDNYANRCACKWQIMAPEGKRVKLEFDQFDTQAKVDYVHVFEGTAGLPENATARFSGAGLPPAIVSRSNQVLIWFITDENITGKGWRMKYSFTDEPPSVIEQKKP
jgi:serine protease